MPSSFLIDDEGELQREERAKAVTQANGAIRVEGVVNDAGKTMSFETGRMAPMADGAAVVEIGDTTLLTTVVTDKPREGIDFFPLTVDVEERMYAAGKIPGSFF